MGNSDLFWKGLPVLDELIRYQKILFQTSTLPGDFPNQLPATLLQAHLIFPGVAGCSFLLGLLFLLAYEIRGKPSKVFYFQDTKTN